MKQRKWRRTQSKPGTDDDETAAKRNGEGRFARPLPEQKRVQVLIPLAGNGDRMAISFISAIFTRGTLIDFPNTDINTIEPTYEMAHNVYEKLEVEFNSRIRERCYKFDLHGPKSTFVGDLEVKITECLRNNLVINAGKQKEFEFRQYLIASQAKLKCRF
ncbi:unnamed protein product [Lactuca saligna]|uniref:Uncharacterized protein n=1 Tax=Lactuca saligna TaxID=75948 RepID=A0AA35V1B5_LACSI|nr:unnamed protein product [Lactuca saligna]